jgi:hypothetical protein
MIFIAPTPRICHTPFPYAGNFNQFVFIVTYTLKNTHHTAHKWADFVSHSKRTPLASIDRQFV